MALYVDLYNIAQTGDVLRNRVTVACLIAAETIRLESDQTANHANRMVWAKGAFADPTETGRRMLVAVLAQNNTLTVAQINGAMDASLQTAVNAAVNVFATGA